MRDDARHGAKMDLLLVARRDSPYNHGEVDEQRLFRLRIGGCSWLCSGVVRLNQVIT